MTRNENQEKRETEQPPAYETPTLTAIGSVDEAVAFAASVA